MELTVSRSYAQHIVVTEHAIVRVERRSDHERRRAANITLAVGGVVGPVLAALADHLGTPDGPTRLYLRPFALPRLAEMTDALTCWAADVPEELAVHPAWPRVEGFRPVTFYPRALVGAVRPGLRGLTLCLKREAAPEVSLPVPAWHMRRIRGALMRAGYPLDDSTACATS